jgi:hypothetical protein
MSRPFAMLAMAAVVLATTAGCMQPPVQTYETRRDLTAAQAEADLVVEGVVARSEDLESYPAGEIWSNIHGKLGQECVVKTRAAFDVTRVLKGPAKVGGSILFNFNAPCFHAEPEVLLGLSLPPVLTEGDRLRIYLANRNGEYWLIAHERLPGSLAPPIPTPAPRR